TQIDWLKGKARDSTDAFSITLNSTMTKSIGSNWTAGTGNGGLDTGSVGNNINYFLFVIGKSTDSTQADALFSPSPPSPALPTSWDIFQRVGWVRTDGAAHIRAFTQVTADPDIFLYTTPIADVSVTNQGNASVNYALSLPANCDALMRSTFLQVYPVCGG